MSAADDTPHPTPRQDTRRTSAEKLERLRELANEMLTVAAREPHDPTFQKLAGYSVRIHTVLDGDW